MKKIRETTNKSFKKIHKHRTKHFQGQVFSHYKKKKMQLLSNLLQNDADITDSPRNLQKVNFSPTPQIFLESITLWMMRLLPWISTNLWLCSISKIEAGGKGEKNRELHHIFSTQLFFLNKVKRSNWKQRFRKKKEQAFNTLSSQSIWNLLSLKVLWVSILTKRKRRHFSRVFAEIFYFCN